MKNFVDTYLKSKNKQALEDLYAFVTNMVPVAQGQTADVALGMPAKGDPEYFYTCVRAPFAVPAFGGVELSSEEEALPVCGAWL